MQAAPQEQMASAYSTNHSTMNLISPAAAVLVLNRDAVRRELVGRKSYPIDCARDRYLESISGLTAVAGALVSEAHGLVFTSNRGENTVALFAPGAERDPM